MNTDPFPNRLSSPTTGTSAPQPYRDETADGPSEYQPLSIAVDDIDIRLSALGAALDQHESSISPILQPASVGELPNNPGHTTRPVSPLVSSMRSHVARLDYLISRLADITSRVDR